MKINRDDLRMYVSREKYDESNPNKARKSVVIVWHKPSNTKVSKIDISQTKAYWMAVKELEEILENN